LKAPSRKEFGEMIEERGRELAAFYGRRFVETGEVPLRSWYDPETQRAIAEFKGLTFGSVKSSDDGGGDCRS
jgi:hypothetical protein